MQGLNFFAETKNGEIVQFHNITFVLDNNLCAWVDKNIIKDIIHNYNANRIVSDNLYIRRQEIKTFLGPSYSTSYPNNINITGGYAVNDIPLGAVILNVVLCHIVLSVVTLFPNLKSMVTICGFNTISFFLA